MRTVLWVTRPEMAPFAGGQHDAMQEHLRQRGWHISPVPYQHRLLWRTRQMHDLLVWTVEPTQLEVWLAKRVAKAQFALIHELDRRHESLPTLDHWITPSDALRSQLCTRGARPHQVSVATFTPRTTMGSPRDVREQFKLGVGARIIYSAGPLVPQAGNRIAIWALNILNYLHPDLHLIVHGEGSERERLEHFNQSIDDRGRVHFVAGVWPTADLVAQADQVWLPRQRNGVPDALFLALQLGKPIVAARQRSLCEWLQHEHNALLTRLDQPAEWAAGARRILDDPEFGRKLGVAARATSLDAGDPLAFFETASERKAVLAA